jgi:uncharacterized Rossmann fold enzyme
MTIAVCTTFPANVFDVCVSEMLSTFGKNWPQDIRMYIQLDEMPKGEFIELNNRIVTILGEERVFIAGKFDDDQKAFIEKWKDHVPKSYLDDVVKFSHKVFALEKCADAIKDSVDYLIWLDADVITKQPIDYEWLKKVLPADDEVCSYLSRDPLHSECGFVVYNLKNGGFELLHQMKNEYVLGNFSEYTKGLTDCHVIDFCLKGKKFKNLNPGYVYGRDDIHVWPNTILGEKMVHRKGNRKHDAVKNVKQISPIEGKKVKKSDVVDSGNMRVKTRNCLDHGKITANVKENLGQIRAWATLCRPTQPLISMPCGRQQEIVICSAGPSLATHIGEIRKLQFEGAKVIAVKHAIDTLKAHGIKPWAVVLLDPRGHVEGFVKAPDPDVLYFVASMCDPSVVKTLNDHKCKVIGYHAYVNAGETSVMIPSDLPVSGGSATGTRSIALFADMFGFKTFHLFGFDLSHHAKPDLNELSSDGQKKYMELSIGTHTHKNEYISRTFWTEGQFLAQSNELVELYKQRADLDIIIYGDGLAGWLFKHWRLYKQYREAYNSNLELKRKGCPTIDEYATAIGRGSDLCRSV